MSKMTIPEVRAKLHEMADLLHELADATIRETPVRRVEKTSQKLTPKLAQQLRRYAKSHPAAPMTEIGIRFGVNPGRVSEALNGKV